ncbi:M14 family zinc carboxypeptidase [Micromonospora sp. NPDC049301]|uniref:M14 family zinc carboxypeptidase n=1 Tax=Micromonospora sp. NPDC049301 TaxID=3155723 RepID=UPI003440E485
MIGWTPCIDYKLATYEQIADYYRKLDKASDRMKLVEIGKTSEGRPQLMAIVSSKKNLKDANLKRYRETSVRLSQGDSLSESERGRWRRAARASPGSTSASTPPRWPGTRPPRSSRTTW